jgi:hypothetical protein
MSIVSWKLLYLKWCNLQNAPNGYFKTSRTGAVRCSLLNAIITRLLSIRMRINDRPLTQVAGLNVQDVLYLLSHAHACLIDRAFISRIHCCNAFQKLNSSKHFMNRAIASEVFRACQYEYNNNNLYYLRERVFYIGYNGIEEYKLTT